MKIATPRERFVGINLSWKASGPGWQARMAERLANAPAGKVQWRSLITCCAKFRGPVRASKHEATGQHR